MRTETEQANIDKARQALIDLADPLRILQAARHALVNISIDHAKDPSGDMALATEAETYWRAVDDLISTLITRPRD